MKPPSLDLRNEIFLTNRHNLMSLPRPTKTLSMSCLRMSLIATLIPCHQMKKNQAKFKAQANESLAHGTAEHGSPTLIGASHLSS